MSLVRWSTIINSPFTDAEEIDLMSKGLRLDDMLKKAQEKNPAAYLSDWYIFWYSMSGDDDDMNNPTQQALAMWLAGEDKNPVADYATVKEMYETDDWSKMEIKIRQKEVLRECVGRRLKQVEARANETNTGS